MINWLKMIIIQMGEKQSQGMKEKCEHRKNLIIFSSEGDRASSTQTAYITKVYRFSKFVDVRNVLKMSGPPFGRSKTPLNPIKVHEADHHRLLNRINSTNAPLDRLHYGQQEAGYL
jgi:hypothetical protein